MAPVVIEQRAVISQDVTLCAGMHDISDPSFQLVTKPITVEADAWVAAEAFIGPGVCVGSCAVVGARAVMFKDATASGVYVGNPAVLIKERAPSVTVSATDWVRG